MSGYLRTRLLASHTASHSASQEVIQRDLIISPSLCVPIAVSISLSLSLIVRHGGHISWQCISDDGEQAGVQSASRSVQRIF